MRRRALLGAAAAAGAGLSVPGLLGARPARADQTVPVDPTTDWGTWQGWGTSLAWWANVFGDRDDLADLFFTTRTVPYGGHDLPGLGFNIARYNAGACTYQAINGESMQASSNIPHWKQIEGFWLNWFSADPRSASWNWAADARQRAMLGKARARGANLFQLFSNSPLWWMCSNHNPSGAALGLDNLQSWNYQQHAVYLATIARYARDHWGIDFASVEPFNEPTSLWRADGTQEGCHIGGGVQQTIVGHLRAELDGRGLTGTQVSASDETAYDLARLTWNSFSADTKTKIGLVTTHGYEYHNGRRDLLYNDVHAAGKPLWDSEYGEGDATGMSLALNLSLDIRWLHPTAWVYWQVLDIPGWGLIAADCGAGSTGEVATKYYVLAQYCRHIRPGMHILRCNDERTVAGYDPAARRLVLVTVNSGAAQQISYDLSRFGAVGGGTGGLIRRWATVTGGTDRYAAYADTHLSGKAFTAPFAADTVQTFEIDNVTLSP